MVWYHVTPKYLGEKVLLEPNVPTTTNENEEGDIPRICVSSSVFKCLLAIVGSKCLDVCDFKYYEENPCVYFTEQTPYLPPNCADFRVNDEHWFLQKTRFFYLGRIDVFSLFVEKKLICTDKEKLSLPQKQQKSVYDVQELFLQTRLDK